MLPWFKVKVRSAYEKENFDRTISSKTELGNPVSIARVYNTISVDVDDTTDFIIKAANNHDALVDALCSALDVLADYHANEGIDHKQVMKYELSVLAKAKAGEK